MSDEEMLSRADIPWTSDPIPHPEQLPVADLLALDYVDLLLYAADLQTDLVAVRGLLYESLRALARVTQQLDRALAQVRQQHHRTTPTERPT